jgi:hypothetical protein
VVVRKRLQRQRLRLLQLRKYLPLVEEQLLRKQLVLECQVVTHRRVLSLLVVGLESLPQTAG